MEKIKINDIQMKGPAKTICVVSYAVISSDTRGVTTGLEATLNTKWQSQEIDYLEKDVGIGGEVSVKIEQKGQYTNITVVDFSSAVKGEVTQDKQEKPKVQGIESQYRTPKEISAQTLTGIFCRNQQVSEPREVLDAYNYFLGEL